MVRDPIWTRFITGLDLGQSRDFTALAVLERTLIPNPFPDNEEETVSHYAVRHLERKPLGASHTAVCDDLVKLFSKPPLIGTMLAVDETGVGRPVIEATNSTPASTLRIAMTSSSRPCCWASRAR